MIVHDGKSRDIGDLAATVWYPVWDAGLQLDHSVRTVKEAAKVADNDMKAALGLLDARFIAGDEDLFTKLVERVTDGWRSKVRDRLGTLEELVRERHDDAHEVAFALEPDIKNGLGGTRDLTILGVLAQVSPVYVPDPALADARETLLDVRVALQRRFGRRERLLLEYQDELAVDLGDADADALMARVSGAARTVAWQSDDAWRVVRAWHESLRGRPVTPRDRDLGPDLVLRDREVAITEDASPADDPSLVFRAAAAAAYEGVSLARETLRRLTEECPPTIGRWTDATRDGFVSLLGAGKPMVEQVELLDRFGLLTPFLPEWERIRCLPQRNAFHQWTVDRHLLETVALAAEHVRDVHRPDLLLVGALLHDLGKGLPGDHSDNGVDLAVVVATRMGFLPPAISRPSRRSQPRSAPRECSNCSPRSRSPIRSRPVRPPGRIGRPACSNASWTRPRRTSGDGHTSSSRSTPAGHWRPRAASPRRSRRRPMAPTVTACWSNPMNTER